MAASNLYWPVYKNLEQELLKLADYIHFSDDQINIYSMHIADLIVRCSVEIEALSKELYSLLGGNMAPTDAGGQARDLYFDTDCLDLLEQKWRIGKKQIAVSAINFFFTDDKNRTLTPLHKANKRGTSGSKWKQAYQAVKHDRRNSLKKANIENLLNALGALYILNVYYLDECFAIGKTPSAGSFDARLGSDVFSVFVAHAEKIPIGNEVSDNDIEQSVKDVLDQSVYIQKYCEESLRKIHREIVSANASVAEKLIKSPTVVEFLKNNPQYRVTNAIQLAKDAGGDALLREVTSAIHLAHGFANANYEAILNKGTSIYPSLTATDVAL